jgi:predicted Fe-S protein YdhL (DUF1289 family)
MNISSPCIQVCQLDEDDVCLGCCRTREEITHWMQLMESERLQIISMLADRQQKRGREVVADE